MKSNHKRQRRFSVIIVCVLIACFTLPSCSVLRIFGIGNDRAQEEPIGGDWRVQRGYGDDYALSDNMTVCFSSLDSGNGYAAYDSSYGGRIGTLMLPGLISLDEIKDGFEIEDYDGDGLSDVGIKTNDGALIRYIFIPGDIGTWPDNIGGCFTCIDAESEEPEDIIDNSGTQITVMTQEYTGNNIAEILMISYDGQQPAFEEYNWKNPEIEMINNLIKYGIQQTYNQFMDELNDRDTIRIRSYPFTSDEWLQIVMTDIIYPSYGSDGNMTSYNFNKKENRYVMLDEAMNDLELTEEIIAQNVKELYVPEYPSMYVGEVKPAGFLICQGTSEPYTLFLLEIVIENPEGIGSWKYFYAYAPQLGELYVLDNSCLFDPHEMDEMNPPLSYQKYPGASLDEESAMAILREELSDKIEEWSANVFEDNSIAIVGYGDEVINGDECWSFALGTDSPEKFTAEEYYAVSKSGCIIYYMNIFNDGKYEEYRSY